VGFSEDRTEFYCRSIHMEFVVSKHGFLQILRFCPASDHSTSVLYQFVYDPGMDIAPEAAVPLRQRVTVTQKNEKELSRVHSKCQTHCRMPDTVLLYVFSNLPVGFRNHCVAVSSSCAVRVRRTMKPVHTPSVYGLGSSCSCC
jgi:hypothetical protein